MNDSDRKLLRRLVDEWVEATDDWFRTDDIWKQYNIKTAEEKQVVWFRLREHTDAKRIEKAGLRYQKIDTDMEALDIFQDVHFVDIAFPFPLAKYIRLSEKSVMVIGGSKDAGKTAFCVNTAILNVEDWNTHLFVSEGGVALYKERILAIKPDICNPLPFGLWDRMDNFAHVIRPDGLNIIDYLDMDSEFYMVGSEIRKILQSLNKGVAIIALQKPQGRDLPFGKDQAIKKAECALALDRGKLKIIASKSRANPTINPLNKTWTFHLDNKGSNFLNIRGEGDRDEQVPF